jgi:hypothetical protein
MARRNLAGTSWAVAAMALLCAARADCQTSEQAVPDAWASRADTRVALLAAGDADSLEAAALLTPDKPSPERLQLLLRAAAAAPARPDLAWLALQSCILAEGCDVAPLEARLRALDPGNGAAWMGTLKRSAPGSAQFNAGLAGVAGSERFDIYWSPLIVHLTEALRRTKRMEDWEAASFAIGIGAAQAVPALSPMVRACKDAAVVRPEDLAACRRLSAVLRHGDTVLIESLGLAVARHVWPASSDEYRQAEDEARVLHYRTSRLPDWSTSLEGTNHYLALLATHRTEQEAIIADLLASGVNPDPPAGWTEPSLAGR